MGPGGSRGGVCNPVRDVLGNPPNPAQEGLNPLPGRGQMATAKAALAGGLTCPPSSPARPRAPGWPGGTQASGAAWGSWGPGPWGSAGVTPRLAPLHLPVRMWPPDPGCQGRGMPGGGCRVVGAPVEHPLLHPDRTRVEPCALACTAVHRGTHAHSGRRLCMSTRLHTRVHAQTHTGAHSRGGTRRHTRARGSVHTHARPYVGAHTRVPAHTCGAALGMPTRLHTPAHTQPRARAHALTHAPSPRPPWPEVAPRPRHRHPSPGPGWQRPPDSGVRQRVPGCDPAPRFPQASPPR